MSNPEETHPETRKVLTSTAEIRDAILEITANAQRSVAIFTQDLEPFAYDDDQFIEIIKRLILARSFARVRVLLADPYRAIRDGNRLVGLGRRLSSYVEFRNVHKDYREQHGEAYLVADDKGVVYRADARRMHGISDSSNRGVARKYLEEFDHIWHASYAEPEFRRLHL